MADKPIVESFQLDHTKVKAPYVRLIDEEKGPQGYCRCRHQLRSLRAQAGLSFTNVETGQGQNPAQFFFLKCPRLKHLVRIGHSCLILGIPLGQEFLRHVVMPNRLVS